MRLFRGESLDGLSRETGLPASRIASWRDASLEAVEGALKSKPSSEEAVGSEKAALERKLGELLMTNELLEEKMRRLQQRPFPGRRSKK
jgi:transposase